MVQGKSKHSNLKPTLKGVKMLNIIIGVMVGFLVFFLILGYIVIKLKSFLQKHKIKESNLLVDLADKTDKIVQASEGIKEVEVNIEGAGSFTVEKKEGKKKREDIHHYPDIVPGEPYEVIVKYEIQDGKLMQVSLIPYYISAEVDLKSLPRGKRFYFEYNLVRDQFEKIDGLRIPMDSFEIKKNQILGWIGICSRRKAFLARLCSIYNFYFSFPEVRISVLENKIPVVSEEGGVLQGKFIEHYEQIKVNGEHLFVIYYSQTPSEVVKEEMPRL